MKRHSIKFLSAALLGLFVLLGGIVLSADAYTCGVVQTVKSGAVKGVESDHGTLTWKGIPYAKAPVGELRWRAPQDAEPWTGTFDATEYGETCVQISGGKPIGSEDCLNLDIIRPATDETGLPVFVFIHGGNNQTGRSTSEFNKVEKFANAANCVVISLNYRLGPLGFNCLPALKTGDRAEDSGNYTLLDIAKALDWVKDNAAAFGGNGGNITISGFSSGGRDIMAMLTSPYFVGKFQKAFVFSGGMTTSNVEASQKVYARAFAKLVVEDGVKANEQEAAAWLLQDSSDVRDYLYGLAPERIGALMAGAGIRMAVFPHLFEDGYILPVGGFASNSYVNAVPVIMFTGSNEFSLFGMRDAYIADRVKDGRIFTDPLSNAEAKFINKYGSTLYGLFNAEESARKMTGWYNAPIYTAWTAWGNDPAIVGEKMALEMGSGHGIHVPMLTGEKLFFAATYPEGFDTPGFIDLSNKFMRYTANFMRKGDPNGAGLTKWDNVVPGGYRQIVFDADMDKANIYMSNNSINYDIVLLKMDLDNTVPPAEKKAIIRNVLNGRWFSGRLDEHFGNASLWVK